MSNTRKQPEGSVYVKVALPAATPYAAPLVSTIVATDVLLLLHVPPAVAFAYIPFVAIHRPPTTVIGATRLFTVVVTKQPVGMVYVTLVMPSPVAVTIPDVRPIVAIDVLALVHEPPVSVLSSVIVATVHIGVEPVIAAGCGLTVTVAVTISQLRV
jgi:hypothetical protein